MNPEMNPDKYAIVIDFDGTITREDVGLAVITEFGARLGRGHQEVRFR